MPGGKFTGKEEQGEGSHVRRGRPGKCGSKNERALGREGSGSASRKTARHEGGKIRFMEGDGGWGGKKGAGLYLKKKGRIAIREKVTKRKKGNYENQKVCQ